MQSQTPEQSQFYLQWCYYSSEPSYYQNGVKLWRETPLIQLVHYNLTLEQYVKLAELWKVGGLMDQLEEAFSKVKESLHINSSHITQSNADGELVAVSCSRFKQVISCK